MTMVFLNTYLKDNLDGGLALKIWLIDDDEVESLIVASMLKRYKEDIVLRPFDSGQEALEALELCSERNCPDLILLDLLMPIMDGFQFLDLYEQTFSEAFVTEIAILTSSSFKEDQKKAEQYSAVTAFIRKPLMLTQLHTLLLERFKLESEH